jgi:CDP-glucose 4,6-dehydratase
MGVIDPQFWKGRSVFMTGHTGFVGSWLSLWLQHMEAKLTGYALEPPTDPSLFEQAGVAAGMQSVISDVRDIARLQSAIAEARPEIILHLAAQPLVRRSYIEPVETFSTNVLGTVNLLEAARQVDSVRAVLIVTSDKCYENHEWVWPYREMDRLGGFDPYSSSKACAELAVAAYRNSFFKNDAYADHGTAVASARAGNIIGGGDWSEDRLVPDLVRGFMAGEAVPIRHPTAIRPWQHVLEPASGYLTLARKLLEEGPAVADAWNFGPRTDDSKSVEWIADRLVQMWGDGARWANDADEHPHEAHHLTLDWGKAHTYLGWDPRWTLDEALERVVRWYKTYHQHPGEAALRKATYADIEAFNG